MSVRVAFRLARRNAWRSPGRSALIIALVALPVAGLSATAVVALSTQATVDERLAYTLGQTEALIRVVTPPDESLTQPYDGAESYQVDEDEWGTPVGHGPADPVLNPAEVLDVPLLTLRSTSVTAATATGFGGVKAVEGPAWDSAFAGRFELISGQKPQTSSEIMVTPGALNRLGTRIGGTVEVRGPVLREFTVVGTLRDAQAADDVAILFGAVGVFDSVEPAAVVSSTDYFVVGDAVSWEQVRELNRSGFVAASRQVVLDPPPGVAGVTWGDLNGRDGATAVVLSGTFALFEVALLAGAAFMVGARQQQRGLAIIASLGGEKRALTRIVSFGGLVLGVLGGIAGVGTGAAAAWLFIRLTSDGSATQYPGFHADPLVLGGIFLVAVLVGWVSAAVPARIAAKLDVLSALRGARRPAHPSRLKPALGLSVLIVGVGIAVLGGTLIVAALAGDEEDFWLTKAGFALVIVGPIAMQLGAVLMAPLALRGAASVCSRLGVGARLGSRDAARNSSRSVPVLAAIMSTVFVASFLMTYLSQVQVHNDNGYQYFAPINTATVSLLARYDSTGTQANAHADDVRAEVTRIFDTDEVAVLSAVREPLGTPPEANQLFAAPRQDPSTVCPSNPRSPDYVEGFTGRASDARCTQGFDFLSTASPLDGAHIRVGTIDELEFAIDEELTESEQRVLNDGGTVSLYPQYVSAGRATIEWRSHTPAATAWNQVDSAEPDHATALPAVVHEPSHEIYTGLLMLPSTADAIGLEYGPSAVLAQYVAMPTLAQRDELEATLAALTQTDSSPFPVFFESGPAQWSQATMWGLLGGNMLITLAAASVALGLARADGRRDDSTLSSLGASPMLRRSLGFWQAAVLSGIGSIVGVILGTVPALVLALPGGPMPFALPWQQLLLAAVAVPLVIALGSWLATGPLKNGRPNPIG